MPFIPALFFTFEARGDTKQHLVQAVHASKPPASQPNTLIMPTALFEQQVFEGEDVRALRNGVWHRPASSTPDRGGNTVFAAHRFTYSNPRGAFYNLDKIHVGDEIGLIWNHKMYRYTAAEVIVVGPHDTYIEDPTSDSRLTLYTCTPLTLPKNRLVVIAKPMEMHHE